MKALMAALGAWLFLCATAQAEINTETKRPICMTAAEKVAHIQANLPPAARQHAWKASILSRKMSLAYIAEMRKMPRKPGTDSVPADHNTILFWKSPVIQVVIVYTGRDGRICGDLAYFMPIVNHIRVIKKIAGAPV